MLNKKVSAQTYSTIFAPPPQKEDFTSSKLNLILFALLSMFYFCVFILNQVRDLEKSSIGTFFGSSERQ